MTKISARNMLHAKGEPPPRRVRRPCILGSLIWIALGMGKILELPLVEPFALTRWVPGRSCNEGQRSRQHALLGATRGPAVRKEEEGEDKNKFCLAVGGGAVLTAESLKFPKSLLVSGLVQVNMLICTTGIEEDEDTLVHIGKDGILYANVQGVKTVEAYGKIFGNIECDRLVVGEKGEIVGDVSSGELAITPGGTIQGVVRCGVKQVTKNPVLPVNDVVLNTDNVGWQGPPSAQQPPARQSIDRNGANLGAVPTEPSYLGEDLADVKVPDSIAGDPVAHTEDHAEPTASENVMSELPMSEPPGRTNLLVDDFGNPLIRIPSKADVDSLRRNRNLVADNRALLDAVKTRRVHEWAQQLQQKSIDEEVNDVRDRREETPPTDGPVSGLPDFLR